MTDVRLNQVTFFSGQITSAVSPWYPLDWRFGGIRTERRIVVSKTAEAEIDIEAIITSIIVTITAMATAATFMDLSILGPYAMIRARKIGSSGAATVEGLI